MYFSKLATYFESTVEECIDIELKGESDHWQLPSWTDGVFMSSGPSKHDMNGTQINHYVDGYGRFSIFKIKDGKVTFSTKMLNSSFY